MRDCRAARSEAEAMQRMHGADHTSILLENLPDQRMEVRTQEGMRISTRGWSRRAVGGEHLNIDSTSSSSGDSWNGREFIAQRLRFSRHGAFDSKGEKIASLLRICRSSLDLLGTEDRAA